MIAFPSLKTRVAAQNLATSRRLTVAVITGLFFFVFPGVHAQSNPPSDKKLPAKSDAAHSGNKENGKKLFHNDGCYECHGTQGQGADEVSGPRIAPPPIPFEGFSSYLHQPAGQMPPYTSKVISDQDLADIYAYLESIPKAPPAKDIPLLNQ
jgi:mono/diheme cytochrome c family protein